MINPSVEYSSREFQQILTDIDNRLKNLERSISKERYTITRNGEVRSFDAVAATLQETKDFVATLTSDMQKKKIL